MHESDWGFQACRLEPGRVWLNKVGTYGMASAAYFWARAAAAIVVRLPHLVLRGVDFLEILLYVDDFILLAPTPTQVKLIGVTLFLLVVLGTPFRWDKFRGGWSYPG